jgi:hypothetical protein
MYPRPHRSGELPSVPIFQLNQAFSRIYSVAAAMSITLWLISILRLGRLSRGVATYGCVTAPLVALLIVVGHLRLNVHGMTVVMSSQVIWFVGMGLGVWRSDDEGVPVAVTHRLS